MRIVFLFFALFFGATAVFAEVERPPQFVALAFDGSKNIEFWKESRAFAKNNDIRFTYFISGVYFLSHKDRRSYRTPYGSRGRSAIGFGGCQNDIKERLKQVASAISDGHEIASHANGHFDGTRYNKHQWTREFDQFTDIMSSAWGRYGQGREPSWWKSYFKTEIKGFRAPLLARGPGLRKALKARHFLYDTSRVANSNYWPEKIRGVWNFPLASLRVAGSRRSTISMDYNFYVFDSAGKRGRSSRFGRYEDRMFQSYMAYFNRNYSGNGNRAPIHIGHHFSAWNGGAYWRAMKRFAKAVCGKREVICGTYKELAHFLEDNTHNLQAYRKGKFKDPAQSTSITLASLAPAVPALRYDPALAKNDVEQSISSQTSQVIVNGLISPLPETTKSKSSKKKLKKKKVKRFKKVARAGPTQEELFYCVDWKRFAGKAKARCQRRALRAKKKRRVRRKRRR